MRIAAAVEYKGTNYYGWQRQDSLVTVQGEVERALSIVANHEIKVVCAGRTDVGVHAFGQIIHLDTNAERQPDSWLMGANTHLQPDIRIKWVKVVGDDFHARFSAIARRYRYIIYNAPIRPAVFEHLVAWHYRPLNIEKMQQASQYLIGKHDFNSFRGCRCQAKTSIRDVQQLRVKQQGRLIIIDVKANAFLMHMVRNIAGLLMRIGEGKCEPIWAQQVLQRCDRTVAAATAPAEGLYLMKVYYPELFGL